MEVEWSWDGIGVELEWTKFVYTPRVAIIKIGFGNGIIRVLFFVCFWFPWFLCCFFVVPFFVFVFCRKKKTQNLWGAFDLLFCDSL